MRVRWLIVVAVLALITAACSSGPSSPDLRPATTTTTTEPPPEGVVIVSITNGSFRPSIIKVDLDETPIVRWVHEDNADREFVLSGSDDEFESPPLNTGDVFEFDFSTLPPGIYRYSAFLGLTRIPGTIDTRPEQ